MAGDFDWLGFLREYSRENLADIDERPAVAPLLDIVLHDGHSDRAAIDDAIIPALGYLTNPYRHNPRVPLPASTIPSLIGAVMTGNPWVRSWPPRV